MSEAQGTPEQTAASKGIEQNVDAIAALMMEETRTLTRHQRAVERMLRVLTVPAFLYGVVVALSLWIGANVGLMVEGRQPWDKPPFDWMQLAVGVLALLMTSVVVITQSRQGRISERNAHLDLQVSLLIYQKAAKIIERLEEMRRDLPNLRDRIDRQAEELQVAVDPTLVAAAIADRLDEAGSADFVLTDPSDPASKDSTSPPG